MSKIHSIAARLRQGVRHLLTGAAAAGLVAGIAATPALAQSAPHEAPKELRIGYQKYGTLVILKARGTLEKRLADKGINVKWTEFPFGPPLLEAINVGSLDVGTTADLRPGRRSRPCVCG
jgi:sulfonate transport system substrate-binding protein